MAELEHLVVSGAEMDRKLVAEILAPYVQLDKDNRNIRPTKEWAELSGEQKIVVYLLARKAMLALNFNLDAEGATASEVIRDTGVKSGTVHPSLRKLLGNRVVDQLKDRRYYIPNYAMPDVKLMLFKAKKEKNG